MNLETQLLFLKIFAWAAWPIFGIFAGLIVGMVRLIDFKTFYKATAAGYVGGLLVVALGYLGLMIWMPTINGVPYDWGSDYLKFVIQIAMFYFAHLGTAYLVRSCRK